MAPTLSEAQRELSGGLAAYPLFVTSDKITPKLIDKFLETEFQLTNVEETIDGGLLPKFYLVTTESVPDPSTIHKNHRGVDTIEPPVKTLACPPIPPFKSPYIGNSVQQVLDVFRTNFARNPFSRRLFVIMDERSARDGTVLLVEDVHEYESLGKDILRARAEFGYAGYSLASPNIDNGLLTEGAHHAEFADPETGNDREEVYFSKDNTEILCV